jgi:hypothetical protein
LFISIYFIRYFDRKFDSNFIGNPTSYKGGHTQMTSSPLNEYQHLNLYLGDLHNHCDMSYAQGSLADAIQNARLQLDFTSVTMHAVWPDMPFDDPKLGYLVDYHKKGFAKAVKNWPAYLKSIEEYNEDGRFVTFASYEWHSIEYGDYCVYFKDGTDMSILSADDLSMLRQQASQLKTPVFLIPHHIGYKQGSRGINWKAFSNQLSPVAEIFSFHGLSESSEGAYPYLHSMGPRHEHGTAQYGWEQGHVFGIVGSTDHHNAFPGSYGVGRLGVWAESLTRDSIWDAISKRRTYALTGDRIELAFSANGHLMGNICPPDTERWIEVAVSGGSSIDYIEVLHNNQIIHRENIFPRKSEHGLFKIYVELGWGEEENDTPWDVDLQVVGGALRQIEPRFRGHSPTTAPKDSDFAYTDWQQVEPNHIRFHTLTRQNPLSHTSNTEGMSLEIEGDGNTTLLATINGRRYEQPLSELMSGTRTFYLGGFVSPALCFHQAVPQSEYVHRFAFLHRAETHQRDWYYVRVRQRNDQWAWSSPIWFEKQGG